MATAKFTRRNMFDSIAAIVESMSDSEVGEFVPADFTANDLRDKVAHELANIEKVADRPKSESAASKRNNADAHKFATSWDISKVFTLADIADVIPTRISTQSRVAVVNVLMRKGLIAKADKVDGHTAYRFTTNEAAKAYVRNSVRLCAQG